MDELPDVRALRVLEPPPGGLERLRERLATPQRRWWLAAVPALAIAVIVLVLVGLRTTPSPTPIPSKPTIVEASPDRGVVADGTFYWVASTPARHVPRASVVSLDQAPSVGEYHLPDD